MYAIDANFGLVRKKSSGQNFSSPKFDDIFSETEWGRPPHNPV